MAVFEFSTRIAYGDVGGDMLLSLHGAMGLMQEAAIIHSDLTGYSAANTAQTHVVWMLVQWRVRLVSDGKWNENVTVRTWPRTMERATSDRDFEIVGSDGRQIAIGTSSWVLVSTDTGRIIRIPREVAEAYDLTARCVFDDSMPEIVPGEGELAYCGKVLRRDIDTNHHMNNRVYLQYADEVLGDEQKFTEVFVRYRKQLLLGQKILCLHRQSETKHVVEICAEDRSVCAIVAYMP